MLNEHQQLYKRYSLHFLVELVALWIQLRTVNFNNVNDLSILPPRERLLISHQTPHSLSRRFKSPSPHRCILHCCTFTTIYQPTSEILNYGSLPTSPQLAPAFILHWPRFDPTTIRSVANLCHRHGVARFPTRFAAVYCMAWWIAWISGALYERDIRVPPPTHLLSSK